MKNITLFLSLHFNLARKFRGALLITVLLFASPLLAEPIFTLDVCQPTPANPRHDHQFIFPLKDGRLMLVWSEYYLREKSVSNSVSSTDDAPCRISAKISSDRGHSWGEPFVFQENTGKLNVKHPNLLRLPSGEVLFFYTEWNSRTNRVVLMRRSLDDCKTWSAPRRISAANGITNINNDHVLLLSSGRIVLPAFSSPSVWDKGDHWQAFCFYSDDGGASWNTSERQIDLPGRGAEEPCMIETKGGAMLAFLRTSLGSIYKSKSEDGGKTWSEPLSTGLAAPAAPPLVKRIPATGDLLLLWNHNYDANHHHQGERNPLSAAISHDNGASWGKPKDVEKVSGGSAAYAAVTFLRDEALVTYYYQPKGFGGASGVRLKIIPSRWFYE